MRLAAGNWGIENCGLRYSEYQHVLKIVNYHKDVHMCMIIIVYTDMHIYCFHMHDVGIMSENLSKRPGTTFSHFDVEGTRARRRQVFILPPVDANSLVDKDKTHPPKSREFLYFFGTMQFGSL